MRRHELVAQALDAIEAELKAGGMWRSEPPPPEQLVDAGPFGMRKLALEQWLQFVMLPRAREIVATGGEFPKNSEVASQAYREWVMHGPGLAEHERIIARLWQLDDVVGLHPKVTRFGFFAGPKPLGSSFGRELLDRFPRATTQYVAWHVEHAQAERNVALELELHAVFFGPDGKPWAEQRVASPLDPSWETSFHSAGWGWDEPGRWVVGEHRVTLALWDEPLAEASFVIE